MERNISPAAILCIVLVSLACVIGIGYGAFAITKGSANEGSQEVASQTSYASNSWKDTYNDSEVTGAQALTLLNEANSKGIAVFVNTRGMCGSTIKAPAEVPVLKHNGKYYMNYGTVFDYEDESYKKASGDITYGDNSGLLQVRDGSSLKVDCNPKLNNGRLVKNEDYTGLYANGSINFVDTHAKFKSNLIYGAGGEVVGVILSQVNRSGYSSLPLSSGGGGSTSSGSNNSGNSNQKPNFSNNVSYGNIPVTPNWTTGGGSSVDGNTPSGGGGNSTEGGTTGGTTGGVEEIDPENPSIYIDNVAYSVASMNTTWSEWVESEDNTIGVKILDGYLVTEDYKIINATTNHKPVATSDSVTNCSRYVSEVEKLKFTLYEYNTYGDVLSLDYESNMTWEDYINSSYNKTTSYAGKKAFQLVKGSGWLASISVRYYDFSVTMGHMLGLIGGSNYILGTGHNNSSVYYQGFAPSDGIPRGPKTETFKIDSVSYEFFDRENWWHWVDSRFNTCGATILADGKISIGGKIVQYNGNDVIYTDEIGSGKTYITYGEVNLISFSIEPLIPVDDTKTYQAEKDMTWRQWLDSSYSTGSGISVNDIASIGKVLFNGEGFVVEKDDNVGITVLLDYPIKSDGVYCIKSSPAIAFNLSVGGSVKSCSAVRGMTWSEWVSSGYYNKSIIGNFYVSSDYITNDSSMLTKVSTPLIPEIGSNKIGSTDYVMGPFIFTLTVLSDSNPTPKTYQTDINMSFADWLNSEYNTDLLVFNSNSAIYLKTSSSSTTILGHGNNCSSIYITNFGDYYVTNVSVKQTLSFNVYVNYNTVYTCSYEEGMSWVDFAKSSYNTIGISANIYSEDVTLHGGILCNEGSDMTAVGYDIYMDDLIEPKNYYLNDYICSFTISGLNENFFFVKGMFWRDFINSEYNIDNNFVSHGGFVGYTGNFVLYGGSTLVYNTNHSSGMIISDAVYTLDPV